MEKNHETIEGEVISDETIEAKKKFSISPMAKKALIVGGAVVGLIVGLALLTKEEPSEAEEEIESFVLESTEHPDGTVDTKVTIEAHTENH
jgi:hypothetical protein